MFQDQCRIEGQKIIPKIKDHEELFMMGIYLSPNELLFSGIFIHKADLLDILSLIAYNLPTNDKTENIVSDWAERKKTRA